MGPEELGRKKLELGLNASDDNLAPDLDKISFELKGSFPALQFKILMNFSRIML